MLSIIFGMTPICGSCAVTRLLGDAFQTMRLTRSCNFVILLRQVAHLGIQRIARKVLDYDFYQPTIFKDAWRICSTCEPCQRVGNSPSWRQQMPQQPMLFCEVFDVWGIDICQGILHSISSILTYYGPQTDIPIKSYTRLKLKKKFL